MHSARCLENLSNGWRRYDPIFYVRLEGMYRSKTNFMVLGIGHDSTVIKQRLMRLYFV
jgi:hypothetical protein